jgi:hypothetical protein
MITSCSGAKGCRIVLSSIRRNAKAFTVLFAATVILQLYMMAITTNGVSEGALVRVEYARSTMSMLPISAPGG